MTISQSISRAQPTFDGTAWVLFNLRVGCITFGTGAVAPIYQRKLVEETRLLSAEQFREALTITQLLPGPSLVSLTMYIGDALYGPGVGVLGVVALCLPGAGWALLALTMIPVAHGGVQAFLAGCGIAAAVLIVRLVAELYPGLASGGTAAAPVTARRRRRRLAVALLVAVLSFCRLSLETVAAIGIGAGLAAEFLP